jgi:hypothetical protein
MPLGRRNKGCHARNQGFGSKPDVACARAALHKLPIKILIINNKYLGMVSQ